MVQLIKNKFIEMLDIAKIEFDDRDKFIHCDIPTLGKITYYPKANKIQISKTNTWEENGFEYVLNILNSTTTVCVEKKDLDIELEKKTDEIFILMKIANMTLTEINTLVNKEREILALKFYNHAKSEEELMKKQHR